MPRDLKKPSYLFFTILFLLLVGAACSTSQTKEEDSLDVIPSPQDAGTDAVPPAAAAETPPVSASLEATPGPTPSPSPSTPPLDQPQSGPAAELTPNVAPSPASVPDAPPAVESSAAVASASPPTAGTGSLEEYTVQRGDTLMKIAFENYGDLSRWKEIYEANKDKISNPNTIPAGVVLKIEKPSEPVNISRNGERYMIKAGDTLGKISNSVYGTESKWRKIWKNNKQLIKNPNKIFAGFYLYYVADSESETGVNRTTQSAQSAQSPQTNDQKNNLSLPDQPTQAGAAGLPTEQSLAPVPAAEAGAAAVGGTMGGSGSGGVPVNIPSAPALSPALQGQGK